MTDRIRKTMSLNKEQLKLINEACSIRFKNCTPDPALMLVLLLEKSKEVIEDNKRGKDERN